MWTGDRNLNEGNIYRQLSPSNEGTGQKKDTGVFKLTELTERKNNLKFSEKCIFENGHQAGVEPASQRFWAHNL